MTVQYSEAPRRKHQQSRTREQNSHQVNGEEPLVPMKTGSDGINQPWRRHDSQCHENGRGQEQQSEDGFGKFRSFLVTILRVQPRIDRNERRREYAFAKKVLQEVRNAEGGAECVGGVRVAEVVSEYAVPHQSDDAAEENSRSHRDRRTAEPGALLLRCGLQSWILAALSSQSSAFSRHSCQEE